MDRRAVRLALGLTVAGASLLTAGVGIWLITAVGRVTPGPAAGDLRLAALALLAGGAACGLAMGFALAAAGRAPAGEAPLPAGTAAPAGEVPGSPAPPPSLVGPRSPMNPPPPSLPPGEPPSGDPRPGARVWWRAAPSRSSSLDDTSEEWLRSLRGPGAHQPPPHSAE